MLSTTCGLSWLPEAALGAPLIDAAAGLCALVAAPLLNYMKFTF